MNTGQAGAGIYIHFPFCSNRCHYCDFNVYAVPDIPQQSYTEAIIRELKHRSSLLGNMPIQSIFLGGGTPSLWLTEHVKDVLQVVRDHFQLTTDVEVTVEMNPNETSPEILDGFIEAGCNRVSLGVQSFRDDLLKRMDRRHSSYQAIQALRWIQSSGFRSWSGDLIFGLPGQSLEIWLEDLEQLLDLGVPHLSTYNLMVEQGTPLYLQVQRGQVTLPEDELQVEMLVKGREVIRQKGREPYEISNSSIPGHESLHNQLYWDGSPYLGIGAGSHGFIPNGAGGRRQSNIRKFTEYITSATHTGSAVQSEEKVDAATHAVELIMTGLRRTRGIDLSEVGQRTRLNPDSIFPAQIDALLEEGLLISSRNRLFIPEKHIPVSDAIFLRFF